MGVYNCVWVYMWECMYIDFDEGIKGFFYMFVVMKGCLYFFYMFVYLFIDFLKVILFCFVFICVFMGRDLF